MSAGTHRGSPGNRVPQFARLCCISAALVMLWSPVSLAFNLDVDKLTVYTGPEGSYFGYSLDFYIPDARTASVLVGAPKANTSQPDIVEGGAVYYCPWPAEGSTQCKQIPFDTTSQVITVSIADIIANYSFKDILRKLAGEKQTDVAPASYDDSYLGYSVAAGEFTGDSQQELVAGIPRGAQNFGYVSTKIYFKYVRLDDILVGAPLFMDREFESNPKEVGQVYLYLQVSALLFQDPQVLTGTEIFGRFGSSVAHLGDLNQDGYNDIAIGVPFAGKDQRGKVLIYNGNSKGLHTRPSQVLQGIWESQTIPSGFGFSLRGDADIDKNDYPALVAEVQLDFLKQKGAIKRTLFLHNHQSHLTFPFVIKQQKSIHCQDFIVYLRDETEFRDKLSPINVSLNYSLDDSTFKDGLEVKPILNHYRDNVVTQQAHILVDCGEDNLCVPDLKLSARPDKHQIIIGDENHLMLIINARNEGEGAYEAELFVMIPEEADYVGIERNIKIVLPIHNWEPEEEPHKEEEVGPLVEHIYELHNIGPSTISDTILEVGWPFSARDEFLLYIFHLQTLGPLRCQTNPEINPQDIKLHGDSQSMACQASESEEKEKCGEEKRELYSPYFSLKEANASCSRQRATEVG
ncbi:hypothetical protein NN561_015391 [Cricetulus griseus]